MFSKSKCVTHSITHPIGFILMLLLVLWAAPTQAQLQVAADIQLAGNADRKLTASTSVAASSGDRIVIEVFASGFEGSLGFQAD
ncbi:MAG: hypothetical protein HN521_15295, partial [Candidatus Latescibacteria bacterium]|nr:hypothetical protein [Candidatus Latescibacterota bacterium]